MALSDQKVQIKIATTTTLRCYLTLVKMTKINKQTTAHDSKDVVKWEHLCIDGGSLNMHIYGGNLC